MLSGFALKRVSGIAEIRNLLRDELFLPLLESPHRPWHRAEWRAFIGEHRRRPPTSTADAERFHDHWHVCHHYVRELVEDDASVLDMLWTWLPPYQGPERLLYRGENLGRMKFGRVGIAWTEDIATARMFAGGLNAVDTGGALIRASAPAASIIAGPSRHSVYLGEAEFTVDPRKLGSIDTLESFPPS